MADTPDIKRIGRYDIDRVLGEGAMGVVYEGNDGRLHRKVAIKTILKSALDSSSAKEYSMRFAREAQAVARLNHPNIVQVFDFAEEGDVAYIVMEMVRGRELKTFFDAKERFEVKEVVHIMGELCEALHAAGRPEVVRLLAAGTWHWLDDELRTWTATARAEIRRPQLEKLSSPLTRLIEAADDTLREEITAALREYGDTVLECLMPALRSAASRRTAGFDEIARDCARRLTAILAQPRREDDDWSIAWAGCRCELCDTLAAFLGSRSRRTLEWPLAKDGRRHVHTQIDSAGLPVRHQTRRQGRPYTLVLTKTDELFTRARTARHTAETDLAWLTATRDDVSART